MKKDTIAAISTGMTNSGIGIVRLSGNEALEIADKVYRGKEKITEVPSHTIHYGHQKELLSHWQFTENCVKKYWTEIVSCFIALLLLWMEKHTCLRLQAEQENPRIQGCGDSISAAGQ